MLGRNILGNSEERYTVYIVLSVKNPSLLIILAFSSTHNSAFGLFYSGKRLFVVNLVGSKIQKSHIFFSHFSWGKALFRIRLNFTVPEFDPRSRCFMFMPLKVRVNPMEKQKCKETYLKNIILSDSAKRYNFCPKPCCYAHKLWFDWPNQFVFLTLLKRLFSEYMMMIHVQICQCIKWTYPTMKYFS